VAALVGETYDAEADGQVVWFGSEISQSTDSDSRFVLAWVLDLLLWLGKYSGAYNSWESFPTETSMLCPDPACQKEVLPHVERCHVCGADVGFPNVRAADAPAEVAALDRRVTTTRTTASARGSLGELEEFGRAVAQSYAVLARSLGDLDAFVKSDNVLYVSFHSQVRAGSRTPEDNDWDMGRMAAESTVHPN
jgi:hypothetical protein